MSRIKIVHQIPTVAEYQRLRTSAGWGELSNEAVDGALSNSLFAVCVYAEEKLVASGRIIGDSELIFMFRM